MNQIWNRGLKRFCDFTLALSGLIILCPLLCFLILITAIFTKGNSVYKQKRIGLHEKEFFLYKFRTMKSNTPYAGTEKMSDEETRKYTTEWGKILRKSSFDELPQLFNILKGDMSFIGPRPGLTDEGEPRLHQLRLSYLPNAYCVKPGLSGYSQIKLKRSQDIAERAKCDSWYVQHRSFLLDTKLFFLSLLVPFGYARNNKKN